MSDFGTLDLEAMAGESSRLGAEPRQGGASNGKRDEKYINIPDPKPGQTIVYPVRILPPAKGARLFQYNRLHMLNGRTYHCPRPLTPEGKWDYKVKCVVCEYYNSLYRQKDKLKDQGRQAEADKVEEEAKSIKPIERYYYNAIARKEGDQTNVGPKIFSVGKVVHKMIVRAIVGDETEAPLGNITDVKTGYDFVVKKEKRGTDKDGYPNYDRSGVARDSSPAGTPEEIKKWSENLHNLAELRQVKDHEVLEKQLAIHRGLIPDETASFDVDEFDRKFTGGKPTATTTPSASVEDRVEAAVGSFDETAAPTPSAPAEDITIEDEDFLKDLEAMEE